MFVSFSCWLFGHDFEAHFTYFGYHLAKGQLRFSRAQLFLTFWHYDGHTAFMLGGMCSFGSTQTAGGYQKE